MATLERVVQMKQQGLSEEQIIGILREEGTNPKEINEAVSQSKIKMALNQEAEPIQPGSMQQSMMEPERPTDEEGYADYSDNGAPAPVPQGEAQEQIYQEYQPEYQPDSAYPEYQPQQSIDIETVNEIAEQIIEEKIEGMTKQISSFTKFKEDVQFEIQKINERLSKIDVKFEELQMAIIKKIGQYGENIENINKEMRMTQQSFSKMLDPLADNLRELQKITGGSQILASEDRPEMQPQDQQRKTTKKSSPDFENYLR